MQTPVPTKPTEPDGRALPKRTVIVGHSYWGRGGAEVVAMWILQALSSSFEVHLLTRGGFDLDELNELSGTRLKREDVFVRLLPNLELPVAGALLHGLYVLVAQKIGGKFDVRITASGAIRWKRPAVHFISSVLWNEPLRTRFYHAYLHERRSVLRQILWSVSDLISGGPPLRGARDDLYIANSNWTARCSAEFIDGQMRVIYPPVLPSIASHPWEARQDVIMCLGRISPEKEILRVVRIVEGVRAAGVQMKLLIVGRSSDSRYYEAVMKEIEPRSDWISVVDGAFGAAKQQFLGRVRYGISACEVEAFGLATAELTRAGVIMFVPRLGAQREIVGNPDQLFETDEEAVAAIVRMARDRPKQEEAHRLALESHKFDPQLFMENVRSAVENFHAPSTTVSP